MRWLSLDDLQEIRDSITDWKAVLVALGIERSDARSTPTEWWSLCPLHSDSEPSFHYTQEAGWFCHGCNQSGGLLELVQKVISERRGEPQMIWEAGRWLLEQRLAFLGEGPRLPAPQQGRLALPKPAQREAMVNPPIQIDLRPHLVPEHEEFARRGISRGTLRRLGAGYLPRANSKLRERLVFQVRGVTGSGDALRPTILSHIGRATTTAQEDRDGRWWNYTGFRKSFALYNLDLLALDPASQRQLQDQGELLLVEGPFDLAKLHEAGFLNVAATFGSNLSDPQIGLLEKLRGRSPFERVQIFYDRDRAGRDGAAKACAALREGGWEALCFPWEGVREEAKDPCDLTVSELQGFLGEDEAAKAR